MPSRFSLPLFLFILCSVAAQLSLKASATYSAQAENFIAAWLLNPCLWFSFVCYASSFIFWLHTLRALPLSSAYPWTALIYVLTPAAAVLIWQEQLSFTYFGGIICILCGILITTRTKSV